MTPPAANAENSTGGRSPALRKALVAALLVGLAIAAFYLKGQDASGPLLRAELDRIRAAGEPLTFDDLEAVTPEVPEESNAGAYYRRAFALLVAPERGGLEKAYRDAASARPPVPPDEEKRQRVRALETSNRPALDLIDQAAEYPECVFRGGLRAGLEATKEALGRAPQAAALLSLRSKERAFSGQIDAALDSAVSLLKLRRVLQEEPLLPLSVGAVLLGRMACDDAALALRLGVPSDAALLRLEQALGDAEREDEVARCIRAERVYWLRLFSRHLPEDLPWPADYDGPLADGLVLGLPDLDRRELVIFLTDLSDLVEAVGEPWPELGARVERVQGRSQLGEQLIDNARQFTIGSGLVLAKMRGLQIGCRIERHLRKTGTLPQSLSELASDPDRDLPVDPFAGAAFDYKPHPDGYEVTANTEHLPPLPGLADVVRLEVRRPAD